MENFEKFRDKNIYFIADVDLDGNGARVLADYYIKPIVKNIFFYVEFDRSLPEFDFEIAQTADIVIFVDITPPDMEFYNKIKSNNNEIILVDHHDTGRKELKELENDKNYIYQEDKCATYLFYTWLTKGMRKSPIITEFVHLVNIYDNYHRKDPRWKDAKSLHNILFEFVDWKKQWFQTGYEKYQKFSDIYLRKFEKLDKFRFTEIEKDKIKEAERKEMEAYKKAQKKLQIRVDNEGNKYGYFESNSKLSYVASILLDEHPDFKYIIAYNTRGQTKEPIRKVSIRSVVGEIDVAKIAEKWDGGGHKTASGFKMSPEDFEKLRVGQLHLI